MTLGVGAHRTYASRYFVAVGLMLAMTACATKSGATTALPPSSLPTSKLGSEQYNVVRTYRAGSMLYLQIRNGKGVAQLGLDSAWGAAITEVSFNGTNYVNAHDTGREVQPALYDGSQQYECWDCTPSVWGWDPVQAGDWHGHGSPVLQKKITATTLYTKTQPLEWDPDNKGGGANKPISTDTFFEQTVSVVSTSPPAFKVHYKLEYFGSQLHSEARNKFPAVYTNVPFGRMTYYAGTKPWTSGPVTTRQATTSSRPLYSPEQWVAYLDRSMQGLTVYVPGQFPWGGFILFAGSGSGSTGEGTNYFSSGTGYGFAPGATLEGDIYLIPGSVVPARKLIYSLHRTLPAVDSFGPLGSLDNPTTGQTISGTAPVYGWLLEPNGKFVVNVLVDGKPFGAARYGVPRPDVRKAYPHAPLGTGFEYSLDTSDLRNGKHTITLNAVNEAGKTSSFFARVTVKN